MAPRQLPGLGPKTWAKVPSGTRQALVVTGRGEDSSRSAAVPVRAHRRRMGGRDDLQDLADADADAGTLRPHREPVRADELLGQVAAAHRVAAGTAGVTLRTTADGTPWLDAGPVRMRQALGNLVSNALRHTPPGGTVTLAALRAGDEVVLDVTDTGSGIAPGELPYVFDRFRRSEKSRSRRTGGSGLGLPIVRHLPAAHGGTAEAWSEPGTGTVFTLRLPSGEEPPDG